MKYSTLLTILAVASTANGLAIFNPDEVFLSNPIDELVKDVLEFVRSILRKHEPFSIPDLPPQVVSGDDFKMTGKFKNLKVSKASEFTIDNIHNNLFNMDASFGVTVPQLHLEGDFEITGEAKGKKVSGEGTFKLDVTQLVTSGYVKLGLEDGSVQMKELKLDYTVKDVKVSETGLAVEGMTQEELESLFSNSVLKYVQDNKDVVTRNVSEYVMSVGNKIMSGKTIQQIIDWLKKFIHSNFH